MWFIHCIPTTDVVFAVCTMNIYSYANIIADNTFSMIVSLISKFPRWSTARKSPWPRLKAGLSAV